jgi:hypothetical protein
MGRVSMSSKTLSLVLVLVMTFSFMLTVNDVNAQLASIQAEDSWIKIAPYPPTYYGVTSAVAFNESIYALAGIDTGQTIFKRYDPEMDTWIVLTPPSIANRGGSLVACQNKIYLVGGAQTVYVDQTPQAVGQITQVYDPATDRWENRSAIPKWILMQTANVVDDKIYLISGLQPAAYGVWDPSEETYVYDTAKDTWSTMASIPTPVGAYASTILDDKIYIIGGGPVTDYHNLMSTRIVQIFDPKTNKWTIGEPIPIGVAWAGACSTSGYYAPKRIYVIGGSTNYTISRSMSLLNGSNFNQVFDPQTGKWSLATPAPEDFLGLAIVNINDALYAIDYGRPETAEKYIPAGYKAYLLPTIVPSNSPSVTDSTVPTSPLPAIEIIAVSSITAIAIAIVVLFFRRHRKTAKA